FQDARALITASLACGFGFSCVFLSSWSALTFLTFFFFLMLRPPPISSLLPFTTLFRSNQYFYHFSNHNFHVFAHGQYHHSFYFFALFDYEIACLLVQLISLFAFYKLHNSYVNRSFLGGTNVRHFRSFR